MVTVDLFRNAEDFVTFDAGQVIFREGEPGDIMYVVIEGQVDILVQDKVIDSTESGGIVGEMALIDDGPRSATAIAKTACKLVPINEKRFTFLVQQTPHFSLNVMRIMSERLRKRLPQS